MQIERIDRTISHMIGDELDPLRVVLTVTELSHHSTMRHRANAVAPATSKRNTVCASRIIMSAGTSSPKVPSHCNCWYSGGGARRRGPHPRFIDATASCERICSAQKTLKREAGMEGAREQRGRGRPIYAIQQQIAAFKTARTRRKHAYKPTFVRSNIF